MACRIFDKTRPFCTGANGDSLGLPASAWSAEYLLQYLQTLQQLHPRGRGPRIENLVSLKIPSAYQQKRQMEPHPTVIPFHLYKPYSCSQAAEKKTTVIPLTNPTVVHAQQEIDDAPATYQHYSHPMCFKRRLFCTGGGSLSLPEGAWIAE